MDCIERLLAFPTSKNCINGGPAPVFKEFPVIDKRLEGPVPVGVCMRQADMQFSDKMCVFAAAEVF